MAKVSPVKEKAMRLEKFVDAAMKDQLIMVFGISPSYGMVAERLGYTEVRFKSVLHGDCHMSTIDKTANAIAGWVSELNAGYVTKGEKNMVKKINKGKDELPELKEVEMNEDLEELESVEPINDDDDMDNLEVLDDGGDDGDDELDSLEAIDDEDDKKDDDVVNINDKTKAVCKELGDDVDSKDYGIKIAAERMNQIKEEAQNDENKFVPLTAKDKWANEAIAMGVTDINDVTMSFIDHKMNRLHVFKAAEGKLPYRQEVYDLLAMGMSKPKVINYEDDKVKYAAKYVIVFEGELEIDACSMGEANAKIVSMVGAQKFILGGKSLKLVDLNTEVNPVAAK